MKPKGRAGQKRVFRGQGEAIFGDAEERERGLSLPGRKGLLEAIAEPSECFDKLGTSAPVSELLSDGGDVNLESLIGDRLFLSP